MPDHDPDSSFPAFYDVIVAGAGPVGLFLACELRLAGLSVLVLEQTKDQHSPLKRLPFGMRYCATIRMRERVNQDDNL
jgi:2-polyprenyl-6-methoxyphenol hydroxylase-like FAD-dependent oxidoreductase